MPNKIKIHLNKFITICYKFRNNIQSNLLKIVTVHFYGTYCLVDQGKKLWHYEEDEKES